MAITVEQAQRALDSYYLHGGHRTSAMALGIPKTTHQRWVKKAYEFGLTSEHESLSSDERHLRKDAAKVGFEVDDVRHAWIKTDEGSYFIKRPDGVVPYEAIREGIIRDMQEHAPTYAHAQIDIFAENLAILNMCDIHIGKLALSEETGSEYNSKIAVERMQQGAANLMAKCAGQGIQQVIVTIGNDILHFDTYTRTTTSGTQQDSDTQFWKIFQIAKAAYVGLIEQLATQYNVLLVHVPSNHDFMAAYFLADAIASHFHNHPSVSVGEDGRCLTPMHRKYVLFGNNLIAFSHGDGAKRKDLPALMAHEAKEAWAKAEHRHIYLGHLHHRIRTVHDGDEVQIEKDLIGLTVVEPSSRFDPTKSTFVETLRSPSESDRWHATKGYKAKAGMEIFIHHPFDGQIARFSETF